MDAQSDQTRENNLKIPSYQYEHMQSFDWVNNKSKTWYYCEFNAGF